MGKEMEIPFTFFIFPGSDVMNRRVKHCFEVSLRCCVESFTLKYWVKQVCVCKDYVCFTVRTFLFRSIAVDFCVCVQFYRPYQRHLDWFPL